MTELKAIHAIVMAGGDIGPIIDCLKTVVVSMCEEITKSNCKDETLLALSVVIDLLRESHKNINYRLACKDILPKNLPAVLIQSFSVENRFIGFLTSKILTLLLAHSALRNDAIHSVKTLIDRLGHNQLTSFARQQALDVLTLLYSRKKLWPEDSEQVQEIQSCRLIILGFLRPCWSSVVGYALSLTSTWPTVDLCSFASLWKKIIKFVDSVEDRPEKSSRFEQMAVFFSSAEKCFPRICTKTMDGVALCRLLKVCNSCLPYSERMSSRQQFKAHHFHLVDTVHTSVRQGLLGQIPSDQLSFIGTTQKQGTGNENSYVLHRQVALLVFKSCALTTLLALEDKSKSDLSSAGKHMLQINNSLLSLWSWLRDETSSSANGHWLLDIFADQDNALLESMLCLMDVYVNISLKKLPTSSPFLLKVINPHTCFVKFLQNLSFDHSVLLDFLSSPETCFLLYFIKYLHYAVRDWDGLKEACEELNVDDNICSESLDSVSTAPEKQSAAQVMLQLDELDRVTTDTQEGLLKLLHKVNTERILLSQQVASKSLEANVLNLSRRNKDVENMVQRANVLLDAGENVGLMGDMEVSGTSIASEHGLTNPFSMQGLQLKLTDYSDSDNDDDDVGLKTASKTTTVSTTVEQKLMSECSKYLDKETDLATLGELISRTKLHDGGALPKLTDYPSSDEEEEINMKSDKRNTVSNKMDHTDGTQMNDKSELVLLGLKHATSSDSIEHMDTNEERLTEIPPDGSDDKLSTHSSDSNLDRVMTSIIRLRIVLERLANKQLFPYNAKPLINVLEQCEVRYEENT